MDRASQVLAEGVPTSYRALADHHGNVSHSTLHHHRARGRPSRGDKGQGQQYLKPYEEVIVKYLLKCLTLDIRYK
jgi:hypothetical protein